MKNKNFKGFTLLECIIALAILGIASLVMAQIYANVSKINRTNHATNTSLAYQMEYVEKTTNSEAMEVEAQEDFDLVDHDGNSATPDIKELKYNKPVHHRVTNTSGVKIQYITIKNTSNKKVYSFPVDYYVLQSRDQDNQAAYIYDESTKTWSANTAYDGERADDYYLNYKYLLPYEFD